LLGSQVLATVRLPRLVQFVINTLLRCHIT